VLSHKGTVLFILFWINAFIGLYLPLALFYKNYFQVVKTVKFI
jgi:hypothetical protein